MLGSDAVSKMAGGLGKRSCCKRSTRRDIWLSLVWVAAYQLGVDGFDLAVPDCTVGNASVMEGGLVVLVVEKFICEVVSAYCSVFPCDSGWF